MIGSVSPGPTSKSMASSLSSRTPARVAAERFGALTLQDPRRHRGHVGIGGQVDRHDRLAVASRLRGHEAEGADGGDPGTEGRVAGSSGRPG